MKNKSNQPRPVRGRGRPKGKMFDTALNLPMSADMKERLIAAGEEEHRPVTAIIRDLIAQYLDGK